MTRIFLNGQRITIPAPLHVALHALVSAHINVTERRHGAWMAKWVQ